MKNCKAALLILSSLLSAIVPTLGFVITTTKKNSGALSAVPPSMEAGATALSGISSQVISSSSVESITSNTLVTYFAEKVIDASVPAVFSVIVIFFFFSQFKNVRGNFKSNNDDEAMESATAIGELYNDLYSTSKNSGIMKRVSMNPFDRGGGPPILPKNIGVPQREFLRITSLNEKYDSYDFSLTKATESKAKAAADFRNKSFDRALSLALNSEPAVEGSTLANFLPPRVKAKLIRAEKKFLSSGLEKVEELQKLETTLASIAMDTELESLAQQWDKLTEEEDKEEHDDALKVIDAEVEKKEDTSQESKNEEETSKEEKKVEEEEKKTNEKKSTDNKKKIPKKEELLKETTKLQKEIKEIELDFIQQILAAVGPKRAIGLRNAIVGDIAVRGTGSLLVSMQERPLSTILKMGQQDDAGPKSLFVMDFPGDVQASQLNELREEVTGVIRNAKPGDEVLVILQSGGGTVTGYGLAAGQLVRLKEKGLYLTIAVEQVAASGGYMMSCVADKIIASPFAVLGSIGVISEIPNVYERLKEEGIKFQTVTAGEFKRTLTPTKKITKEDLAKSEEDIAEIFNLFKGWVAQNRPSLNIDEVATGETWFGPAALEKGLCDDIKTVDDILLDYIDNQYSVYKVKYDPPPEIPSSFAALFASSGDNFQGGRNSIGRQAIRWLVTSFVEEIGAVTGDYNSLDKKFMAKDETKDRVRASASDKTYY